MVKSLVWSFTFSKSAMEISEQCVKSVNNKDIDDVNGVVLVSILLTLNRCLMVENGVFCFNFERILYISQVSVLLLLLEGSSELANLFRFLIVIHDLPSIYGTQVELVHRPNPFHNRLQVYCCPHESFHRLKLLLRSKF